MAVAGDAAVGDTRGVKELGVDALVALAGALVAREAAFGRAPVEAVVVLQLVERPVVEPQRHVVFRAVCLLPALGHGVVDDLRDARAGGVVTATVASDFFNGAGTSSEYKCRRH